MYSRPTTEQILLGVARDLQEQVLPHVSDEPARVALGMIGQLLRGCAVRSAHEIAWAEEESEQIAAAVEGMDDPDVVAARSALAAAPAASLHLDDVLDHYHRASVVLSAGLGGGLPLGRRRPHRGPPRRPRGPHGTASSRSSASSTSSAGGRRLAGAPPGRPRLVGGSGTRR